MGYVMSFLHPPNGQRLPCWLAGLLLLLIFSSCTPLNSSPGMTPGNTPRIDPLVDTWNNIHLFLSFDYKISNPAAVASHYDFVWGASVGGVAAFRSGNPNIFISYYMPFHRDNGTFSNSGAYHDLAYWKTVHSDWVLYKCDRVTPAYEFGNPNMPLDFANPAVLSWQIQTYAQPASESGYDGIAADNVDLQNQFGACGVYINGQWVQRYTGQLDDPRWRTDVINWLTQMQQALHHLRQPLALIPNFSIDGLSPSDPLTQQVISHIDGLEDEEGFTRYGDGYLTGKEHSAALFTSTIQGYGADLRYDEYNIQIGSPKGPMYQTQNVYMRDYSHGLSIVNPSATDSYMVTLNADGHYRDVSGDLVGQTITMPPHSGMVLLTGF